MPFDSSVLQSLDRATLMHQSVTGQIPKGLILDTDEKQLVGALFSLTLDFHGAILTLFRFGGQFDGSAFALVRPLIDAAYRAHWIYSCASPEIVQRILQRDPKCYPGLSNMADGIEKKLGTDGLFLLVKPYIESLHGFTHGGLEQIARRFDSVGNIHPSYDDDEKVQIVNVATAHLTALAIAWCQIASSNSTRDAPGSKAISERHIALYKLK